MYSANHKAIQKGFSFPRYIIIIFPLAFLCACTFSAPDYHSGYFSSILKKTDDAPAGEKEKAFALMDSAFNVFPYPGTGDLYDMLSRKRDFYYHFKKDYIKGMKYNDSIIAMLKTKISNERFAEYYTEALFVKGDLYLLLKNYNESLHYYVLAKLVMTKNVKDTCKLVGFWGRNARLYFTQGKYLLASGYYLQCYREQSQCASDDFLKFASMQENLDNAGMCYNNAEMPDSADYYFSATLNFIGKNGSRFPEKSSFVKLAKAVVYANQASVLAKKNNFTKAEELFTQSIYGTANLDVPFTQFTLTNFAQMYFKSNEPEKADKILFQLKISLDSLPNEAALVKWYQLKKDYYQKTNSPLAAKYTEAYLNITDSILARDRRFTTMDINSALENREQKAVNEMLTKENELQSLYLLIAAVIIAMTIIIALLVFRNLRYSRKYITQLTQFNKQISARNQELYRTLISLEQSQEENSRIMRIVAHDLKNPVSAMQNLVWFLLKKDMPLHFREVLLLIKEACGNSLTLIRDLQSDKLAADGLKNEASDMKKLLEYCAEMLQGKAEEKGQRIVVYAEDVMVKINKEKMWRVINNLINNAVKFSWQNAIINIKLQRREKSVLISVQDYGIGIPEELRDKILSNPGEARRAGTAGEESHGLGLSISSKIVEEHKGRLWFESEVNQGSVFYVELPSLN